MNKKLLISLFLGVVVLSSTCQTTDTTLMAQNYKFRLIDSVHYSRFYFDGTGEIRKIDLRLDSIRFLMTFHKNLMPESISYRLSDEIQGEFGADEGGFFDYTCESFECDSGWQVFYDTESKNVREKLYHENGRFTGERKVYSRNGTLTYESFRSGIFLIVNFYNDDLDIIERRKINMIEKRTTIDYYDPDGFRYQRDIGDMTDVMETIIFNRDGTSSVKKFNID
jgi:hypothetical protein